MWRGEVPARPLYQTCQSMTTRRKVKAGNKVKDKKLAPPSRSKTVCRGVPGGRPEAMGSGTEAKEVCEYQEGGQLSALVRILGCHSSQHWRQRSQRNEREPNIRRPSHIQLTFKDVDVCE